MKKSFITLLILASFLCAVSLFAQTGVQKNPYTPGEEFVYVGKYKTLFGIAVTIGDMHFAVRNGEKPEIYTINIEAESSGTLASLFNFDFLQRINSTVDGKNLRVLKTQKRDEQRKRIRNSTADFDYEDMQVIYTEIDPNDPSRPPRNVASPITPEMQDFVTAVYMLRQMPLAVGKTFVFKISDSGLVYDVPVTITGRERKSSSIGKRWCWKIVPDIFGEGKPIEQEGELIIWITDDEERIPLRASLDTTLGDVEIKLKKYTKAASPNSPQTDTK